MYLTSLHSTNQKNKEMYILEDLDYFLSTNEKQYIQNILHILYKMKYEYSWHFLKSEHIKLPVYIVI